MYSSVKNLKKLILKNSTLVFKTNYKASTQSIWPTVENVIPETRDRVALIRFNRPRQLNALCAELFKDLIQVLKAADQSEQINCIVLTGNEKAFAAGADIKEMKDQQYPQAYTNQLLGFYDQVTTIRKPIIAAVNGYALGGGCELAMMCDIILAGSKAKFGQPEINIGTIPGMGGTQRLCKYIGKSRAMEMILTGEFIDAQEALRLGLVSRVYEPEILEEEAIKMAQKIAAFSSPAVQMAKEAVNFSYESTLSSGLSFEKKLFWSTFATNDQKEGMQAFIEKRKPEFKNSKILEKKIEMNA